MRSDHSHRFYCAGIVCALMGLATLGGCATGGPVLAPATQETPLVQGPPIAGIASPFDIALQCLKGRINQTIPFSVGAILDMTGKEQLTEGGSGKFITQGAGDIVQSALLKTGAMVINRRDPRIMETEVKWGLVQERQIIPSRFFVTGSINSLDFIPGGGIDGQIGGIGGRYRQSRALIGLDLSLTDATTSRIVANIAVQKQIFTDELDLSIGKFFGESLVTLDAGKKEREALHLALRSMLDLATFELLTQLMQPANYGGCRVSISQMHGDLEQSPSAIALRAYQRQQAINDQAQMPEPVDLEKAFLEDAF